MTPLRAFDLLCRANMKNMAPLRRNMEKRSVGRAEGPISEGQAVPVR